MSENESEKRDTLADIVADMRKAGALMTAAYMRDLLNYADRIEAAWRRERAEIEANALSVGGIVEAARHKPGNAAAMREALETIHFKVNCLDEECGVDPVEIRDIARAALSKPARNCDRFNRKDPVLAKNEAVQHWQNETDCAVDFGQWLFAQAEEQKGECDGR